MPQWWHNNGRNIGTQTNDWQESRTICGSPLHLDEFLIQSNVSPSARLQHKLLHSLTLCSRIVTSHSLRTSFVPLPLLQEADKSSRIQQTIYSNGYILIDFPAFRRFETETVHPYVTSQKTDQSAQIVTLFVLMMPNICNVISDCKSQLRTSDLVNTVTMTSQCVDSCGF